MSENINSNQNGNQPNSSLGKAEEDQQNTSHAQSQDPTATPEEIENANKAQPNVILNKVSDSSTSIAPRRDTARVSDRANEAPDSTDTNTGSMIAGGAKGASQS